MLIALAVPLVLAGVGVLAVQLLIAFVVITVFSIGGYYVPSALLLLAASILATRNTAVMSVR